MEVKVEGKKYEVKFVHFKLSERCGEKGQRVMVPYRTQCTILAVSGKKRTTVSTGYSQAHTQSGDQFEKGAGRRVAMTKALSSIWPQSQIKYDSESGVSKKIAPARNREIRAKFWAMYFAQVEATKKKGSNIKVIEPKRR